MAVTKRVRNSKGKRKLYYQAEVYIAGVRVDSRLFETKSAAHAWHDETLKRHKLGESSPGAIMTFRQVVERYRTGPFQELRPSSQQAREPRFRYLLDGPLSGVVMQDFGRKAVDRWLEWLRAHPTTRNAGRLSFHQELKILSVVLNWYREEFDHRFAVPIVEAHRRAATFKPVPARRPDYYIDPKKVEPWIEALRKRPDPVYGRLATLMVLTGLRLGEAAGLCWDAVDLDSPTPSLRIVRTLAWHYKTKEPYLQDAAKTEDSIRVVSISGAVLRVLREVRSEGHCPTDRVFVTRRGRMLLDNTVRANFNRAFEAAGLPWSGTHIARHTFATLGLLSDPGNLGGVQAALGHKSQRQTEVYAKVVALRSSKVTDKVQQLVGLSGGRSPEGTRPEA